MVDHSRSGGEPGGALFSGDSFHWRYKEADISTESIRPIELEGQDHNHQGDVRISIQAATFNVLSLNRRATDGEEVEVCRFAMLRRQLELSSYQIVGLQETRTNCATTFVAILST